MQPRPQSTGNEVAPHEFCEGRVIDRFYQFGFVDSRKAWNQFNKSFTSVIHNFSHCFI